MTFAEILTMNFNFLKKGTKVTVTAVNLKWRGSTHALGKIEVKGKTFEIAIPFQNKQQESFEFLNTYFKQQKKPAIRIKGVAIKEPFKLVSAFPVLPVEVVENDRIILKLKVNAPDYSYEGPLTVELLSDSSEDMVHVEVSKIVIRFKDKVNEIKDKALIMDISKGQVFKQNLHLFGSVEFGGEVKKIEILPPFAFVSSDPQTPFKVDNKTGYLIDLFIQGPRTNYGGPLEIVLS